MKSSTAIERDRADLLATCQIEISENMQMTTTTKKTLTTMESERNDVGHVIALNRDAAIYYTRRTLGIFALVSSVCMFARTEEMTSPWSAHTTHRSLERTDED